MDMIRFLGVVAGIAGDDPTAEVRGVAAKRAFGEGFEAAWEQAVQFGFAELGGSPGTIALTPYGVRALERQGPAVAVAGPPPVAEPVEDEAGSDPDTDGRDGGDADAMDEHSRTDG